MVYGAKRNTFVGSGPSSTGPKLVGCWTSGLPTLLRDSVTHLSRNRLDIEVESSVSPLLGGGASGR